MKRIIICLALLTLSTISFSQPSSPSATISKEDYLQKSKHQRNTALILAGGGLVLEISGVVAYQYGNASIFLFGAGLLSQVVAIPFAISAGINKKKAKQASVALQLKRLPCTPEVIKGWSASAGICLKVRL